MSQVKKVVSKMVIFKNPAYRILKKHRQIITGSKVIVPKKFFKMPLKKELIRRIDSPTYYSK